MPLARTALITGSCLGVGRAIALRLASDGFNVALNGPDWSVLEEIRGECAVRGYPAAIVLGDVSKEEAAKKVIAQTVKKFGELNVLVANGASRLGGIPTQLSDSPMEEFDQIAATNIRGTFLSYQCAARQMIAQGKGGKIIGAFPGPSQGEKHRLCPLSASRFAIHGMTQVAATELERHGIKVNCYSVGLSEPHVDQASNRTFGTFQLHAKSESSTAFCEQLRRHEDVVSFLASDASNWITGQTIDLDGATQLLGSIY